MEADRARYEAAVRAIAIEAEEQLARGAEPERVARAAVERRNALKQRFREGVDPNLLRLIELRNVARYGDPLGPTAEALFRRYGSWEGVISAAGRHARFDTG